MYSFCFFVFLCFFFENDKWKFQGHPGCLKSWEMPFWCHSRLLLLFLRVFLKASIFPSICRPNIPSFLSQFLSTEMDSLDLQFWLLTYVYHFELRWMRFYCINLKHIFKGSRYRIPHLQWAISTSRVCSEVSCAWQIFSGPHIGNKDESVTHSLIYPMVPHSLRF